MLRKPALVLIISLTLVLFQTKTVSANSYFGFHRYITSLISLFKHNQENTFPKIASGIYHLQNPKAEDEKVTNNSKVAAATITNNATPTPTKTQTPPVTTPKQTETPPPENNPSPVGFIMNEINNYRKSHGLSEVRNDPHTCNFAGIRAQEIANSFNHDGFQERLNNNSLPYPGFSEVSENIAMHTDYKAVVQMWIGSPGHEANLRKNTPYVCVAQNGNYFAFEGWRP
jgi:uncharacterized protein YkwD